MIATFATSQICKKTPAAAPCDSMIFRFMIIFSILLCPTLKLLYSKNTILCRSFCNIKNVGQINLSLGGNDFCRYPQFYVLAGEWKRTDQCWWFSLFCENCWFWFLGQVLKTAAILIKTSFSHSDNCPSFQNLKKIMVGGFLVQQFSKNFKLSIFRDGSHKSWFFCCIYYSFFLFFFFFSYNQHFFCAKFCLVAKSENNLWQGQRYFIFFQKIHQKSNEKSTIHQVSIHNVSLEVAKQ